MEQLDFFEGRRHLTGVVILMHRGKTSLVCTPWEEWRLISPGPFTLRCGNKREQRVTRKFGIEQTERESFESTLGSTLGAKGVASVENSLKAQIGHEVKFSVGTEVQETFTFDSPVCGYKTVRIYQKVRCVHLKYDDQRFWHHAPLDQTVTQWLSPIYDGSTAEQYSPECNCDSKKQPAQQGNGIPARIDMGTVAKLAGFFHNHGRLFFADGTDDVADHFSWHNNVTGRLSGSALPDYLRFLANIDLSSELEAAVWQEFVLHPTTPSSRVSDYATIELDDDMEPIEGALPQSTQVVRAKRDEIAMSTSSSG